MLHVEVLKVVMPMDVLALLLVYQCFLYVQETSKAVNVLLQIIPAGLIRVAISTAVLANSMDSQNFLDVLETLWAANA